MKNNRNAKLTFAPLLAGAGIACALMAAPAPALAVDCGAENVIADSEVANHPGYNGWTRADDGEMYWYDYGVQAKYKEVYDPETNAWYWFDIDGTLAFDKDVLIPNQLKWVRYDENGHMIYGEDVRVSPIDNREHRWYFDTITGEMLKGFQVVPDGEGGTKTVYYDMTFGWMLLGKHIVNGVEIEFDKVTGEIVVDLPADVTAEEARIISIAESKLGCPYKHAGLGPNEFSCDGFTYWVYNEAGYQLWESMADSSFNAQSKWLRERGLLKYSKDELEPGDIVFFGYGTNPSWDNLRHAAIYLGVNEETGVREIIHSSGHWVDGVKVGVCISPLDGDQGFLGGGSPIHAN